MSEPSLETLDRDGALREAASRLPRSTRRDLLARAGRGTVGALLAGLAVSAGAEGKDGGDIDILNYALTLEYLQAAFYTETERNGTLTGVAAGAARQIGAVERSHVTALRTALGSKAVARPAFDFEGATSGGEDFLRTAVAFEDLATAAYKGQLSRIRSRAYLGAALGIHSVEARHAAWIRYLAQRRPAANAFDEEISRPEAEALVASTGFIVARPVMEVARRPSFAG